MATGTVTITEKTYSSVKKINFVWTCTTGGAASDTTTKYYDGEILRVVFGDSGSTGYALVLDDSDGYDTLEAAGATLTSGSSQIGVGDGYCPYSAVSSKLTLTISGAGNATTGETIVYIR